MELVDQNREQIHSFDVKSIDIIFNPEYEEVTRKYKIPIFFKSTLDDPNRINYMKQGYLDNGRHVVPLKDKDFVKKKITNENKSIKKATTTTSIFERLKDIEKK